MLPIGPQWEMLLLNARDWIHANPGREALVMPPRKVRRFLLALERRNLIVYREGGWFCRCVTCVEWRARGESA